MKILLHIGQSKTGTSAIQTFLTLNRNTLAQHGVLYPAIKVAGMPLDLGAHNAVADALQGMSRFPHLSADEYFEYFFDEAQKMNAQMLILSGEHFFGGEPRIWDMKNEEEYFAMYRQKLLRLTTYLEGHDVNILLYLRPQVDWFSSAIAHTVRISGLIPGKALYENDRQYFNLIKPLLMYSRFVDLWGEILKPTSFKVIPYNRKTLHKNSSIADFLLRAGLSDIEFPHAGEGIQVNESLTREYIEVKKILNSSQKSKNSERVIIRCLERLSSRSKETSQYVLSPDVRHEVIEFSKAENKKLNMLHAQGDVVFIESAQEQNQGIPQLDADDIKKAYDRFNKEYRSFSAMVLRLNFATRTFIRTKLPSLQALIHNLKMIYLKAKYRN